jgi:hypothetical protein
MYEITISFKDKKHYNKFLRNLKKNQGTVIKPDHLSLGAGFFDSLKKVANNPIVKAVVSQVAPLAIKAVSESASKLSGSDAVGNVLNAGANAGLKSYTQGSGMKKGFKSMKDKMAYLRSLKKGSSIVPL